MTIHAQRVMPSHTDGDSIVSFREGNVLHFGDTFFNGLYPFIDIDSGGSIRGMIEVVNRSLPRVSEKTKIIPGHGPLADKAALLRYRDMMQTVADRVEALIEAGRSKEEVVAAKPTAEYDAKWGNGFIKPDQWVALVYALIVKERAKMSETE